jgi:antitoxin component YwqK of YwqJK toxin-antitoxin module
VGNFADYANCTQDIDYASRSVVGAFVPIARPPNQVEGGPASAPTPRFAHHADEVRDFKMQRVSIDWRLVAKAALLTTSVVGFQRAALAQDRDALRVPEAFSSDTASPHTMRLDERDGAGAATVEIVTERYPDGKARIERQVALDTQGNYVNHGTWKMWAPDGSAVAEGQYDMGKRVGTWTRWLARKDARILNTFPFNQFKAPFVSQVTFVNDQMDGQWLIVDADQRQCMQISISNGKRNGQSITWQPNGKILQQASYEQGVPVGDVLEVSTRTTPAANGQRAEKAAVGEMKVAATYVDGRRIVTKTANYPSRKKQSEELFLAAPSIQQTQDDFWNVTFAEYKSEGQDLRHGTSKSWFENGKPRHEGIYDHDKKHGMFTYWHSNGQMAATGEYQNDKPIGSWVWWHENGLKSAFGEYRDGYLFGQWRWWAEDGQLAKQKIYDGTEKVTSEKLETDVEVGARTSPGSKPVR